MTLTLYAHPFASYCRKALIALYENATPRDSARRFDPCWRRRLTPAGREIRQLYQFDTDRCRGSLRGADSHSLDEVERIRV
jgi:hypothetical protein